MKFISIHINSQLIKLTRGKRRDPVAQCSIHKVKNLMQIVIIIPTGANSPVYRVEKRTIPSEARDLRAIRLLFLPLLSCLIFFLSIRWYIIYVCLTHYLTPMPSPPSSHTRLRCVARSTALSLLVDRNLSHPRLFRHEAQAHLHPSICTWK